jgi:hypothetical protein
VRRKLIAVILLTLADLSKMGGNLKVIDELIREKIEKYEFIIKKFQVDSKGPSFDHLLYTFNLLQSQINQTDSYKHISPDTKNLLTVFKIYHQNLFKWQFIDPSLFPKPVLAIISHQNLTKKKIFELIQLPNEELLQLAVKSLELVQIEDLISRVKNEELNFIPEKSDYLSFKQELCHYLINLKDVLTPNEDWIVRVYLELLKY